MSFTHDKFESIGILKIFIFFPYSIKIRHHNPFRPAGYLRALRFWDTYARKIGISQKISDTFYSFFAQHFQIVFCSTTHYFKSKLALEDKIELLKTGRIDFLFAFCIGLSNCIANHHANFKLKFKLTAHRQ